MIKREIWACSLCRYLLNAYFYTHFNPFLPAGHAQFEFTVEIEGVYDVQHLLLNNYRIGKLKKKKLNKKRDMVKDCVHLKQSHTLISYQNLVAVIHM